MNMSVLIEEDISELESILISDGRINSLPFQELERFSQNQISQFCHKHGIYQIPTQELIDFLRNEIGEKSALEIGSGNGCIGRSLGIRMADNKMQEIPEIRAYYNLMGQAPIKYGTDVEHLDGLSAIQKYRPEVVIACWVTQKWKEGMKDGNALGVDETKIFDWGADKYVHVGNEITHQSKEILTMFPVRKFKHKSIISRSMSREKNIIYVFTKK